jgi:hypothetical protein
MAHASPEEYMSQSWIAESWIAQQITNAIHQDLSCLSILRQGRISSTSQSVRTMDQCLAEMRMAGILHVCR